jgi:drug/metabolite transporter (DMT)-like permease
MRSSAFSQLSDHAKGLVIMVTGVLIVSPDALLIRLISLDSWSLLVWRGGFFCISLSLVILLFYGRQALTTCRKIGRIGLLVACFVTIGNFCFVIALNNTLAANALVIMSGAPLFAAFFGWFFLKERPPLRIWVSIAAVIVGILVIVSDGLAFTGNVGDLAAVCLAMSLAASFTATRRAKDRTMIPATALGGAMTALLALPLAPVLTIQYPQFTYLLLMGFVMIPLANAALVTAPRYLPAPEVSLILLVETVLGPFWVWLVLAEAPPARTWLGGTLIVGTLVINSLLALRKERRRKLRASPSA